MNVIIANKYKEALAELNIDVLKVKHGEFTVEEIVNEFKNYFFQKMILDITALKNYKDIKTLQKLSLSLDMDRLILLLDGSPEVTSPEYLSDLISMHIYNFTMNIDGIRYLYDNPNSYRDVAQYHQLDTVHNVQTIIQPTQTYTNTPNATIIGIKNLTQNAGATTLTYIMKKQLERNYNVVAIEIDKTDFMYFSEKDMYSIKSQELGNTLAKYRQKDIILIDINQDKTASEMTNQTIYLIEPSKIKLNKLLTRNPKALEPYKNKCLVLNQSQLNQHDILDFEYETNTKIFYNIPPLYDQQNNNPALDQFLIKLGFTRQANPQDANKKGLFDMFK